MQSFLRQNKDKYTKSNKQVKEGQINPKQTQKIQEPPKKQRISRASTPIRNAILSRF